MMMLSDEARPLYDAATAAQTAADYLTLARLARKIIALCEGNGDKLGLAWGQYFAAAAQFQRNDGSGAARSYRQAEELFTELGDRMGMARCMLGLAAVALDINLDVAEARRLYDLAVPIVRESKDKRRLGIVLGNLGEICRMEGDYDRALRYAEEAVTIFREIGDSAYAGWQYTSMGHYHLLRREYAAAIESMHASYPELLKDPIPRWFAWYFDVWFIIAAALDRWELAARLLGFVNRYRDDHSTPRLQGTLPWLSRPIERLSEHIAEDRLSELFIEGESLSLEQARALVADVRV